MSWTRRDLLRWGAVAGAVTLTGACGTRVGGRPLADPSARPPTSEPTSDPPHTPPEELGEVELGILAYPPYAIPEGSGYVGPVPDVATVVLEKLGAKDVKITKVEQPEELVTRLVAGQFDLIGGLTATGRRCRSIAFSAPDYLTLTGLLYPAGNPKGLKTYAEVAAAGARMAVLAPLPEAEEATASGVPESNIVRVNSPDELTEAVGSGQADCAAFDDIILRDMAKKSGGALEASVGFAPPGGRIWAGAYGFAESANELLEPFNEVLRALHESGEWLRRVEPFGLTKQNEPPADLTIEKACASG